MIETLANITTTVVAVLLSIVLVRVYFFPTPISRRMPATPAAVAVGTSLKGRLPVDWSENGHTLILAISTHCHFCTESAPFFRRLQEEKIKGVKVVAVLPETVDEATQYLKGEGVRVDEVRQASLPSIGITGTPTILFVDDAVL
ncbi:MAG TPA: hypothetical protein VG675_05425 [Bryobacteraceae bacterium]|nr:hypothetical protein [Bryobacteraceae bacterium]